MMLSDLQLNECAKIIEMPKDKNFALRLYDMGISEGCKVKCLLKPLLKSPILFLIKDTLIAIRLSDCRKIEVEYE